MSRLAFLLLLAGCSRTPAEPEPAATTAAQAQPIRPQTVPSAVQKPQKDRCIAPMASAAPELPKPATTCPADPENGAELAKAKVIFPEAKNLAIDAELALSQHDIEKGLMYRRHMNDDHGMLFKLEEHADHTFWMQNTCIPLDMLFIDDDGTVVGVVEGAAPLTTSTRSVGCESRYVLEMNAGWCRSHGVKPGQKVSLPSSVH